MVAKSDPAVLTTQIRAALTGVWDAPLAALDELAAQAQDAQRLAHVARDEEMEARYAAKAEAEAERLAVRVTELETAHAGMREALVIVADYGHEMDDYVLPSNRARKIARVALELFDKPVARAALAADTPAKDTT